MFTEQQQTTFGQCKKFGSSDFLFYFLSWKFNAYSEKKANDLGALYSEISSDF